MAGKDPKDTLDIQQDIANVLARQQQILENINKTYDAQTQSLGAIAKALGQTNADVLNKSAQGANRSLSLLGKTSKDLDKALKDKLGKTLGSISAKLMKFGPIGGFVVGAFTGLSKGLKNIYNAGKLALSVISGIADSTWEIGKAILAIPIKIYDGFIVASNKAGEYLLEYRRKMEDVRKEFGTFKGAISSTVIETSRSMKGFSATGLSTWQVFGNMSEKLQYVKELISGMGAAMGPLTKEFKEQGGALLGYQKGLGLSAEQMKAVAENSIAIGKPLEKNLREVTQQSVALGKSFQVDAKLISRDVGKAMQDVKHFAGASVKEISQASVYSRKLGIELDKIVGTMDKFETFDSAADSAAQLSQSFGVIVDTFELMEAQDPAKKLEILKKGFAAAGKSTENMTYQELDLVAQTTGLSAETAKLALSMKNQGKSLQDVQKDSDKAGKKTLTTEQAMSKLADSIERLIKNQPKFTGFFDAFIQGFTRGIERSGVFMKAVFNLRDSLLAFWRMGMKVGDAFVKIFPGVQKFFEAVGEFFEPKKFQKFADKIGDIFTTFFKNLSVNGFAKAWASLEKDFFSIESPALKKILAGAQEMLTAISSILADGLKYLFGSKGPITQAVKDLAKFISNPTAALEEMRLNNSGATSFMGKVLQPLWEAITDPAVFGPFFLALEDLFREIWEKIKKSEVVKDVVYGAMIYLAGTVLLNAITTAFSAVLAKLAIAVGAGLLSMFTTSLTAIVSDIAGALLISTGAAIGVFVASIASAAAVGYGIGKFVDWLAEKLFGKSLSDAGAEILTKWDPLGLIDKEAQEKSDMSFARKLNASKEKWKREADAARAFQAAKAKAGTEEEKTTGIDTLKTNFGKDPERYAASAKSTISDIEEVKKKLDKVDVKTVAAAFGKLNEIGKAVQPLDEAVSKKLELTGQALNALGNVNIDNLIKTSKMTRAGALAPAMDSIKTMVAAANDLDTALSDKSLNKLNITAKLQNVANAVGLGASGKYTVTNKDVNFTVNLTVTMNAGDLEKVIIQRKESVIRDRLVNANYVNPTGLTDIPVNANSPSPAPIGPKA